MCGIAGIVSKRRITYTKKEIDEILQLTNHRGPDSNGYLINANYALFHNRLSIQDLSENGIQPMSIDNLHIVFNGEIYNHLELRSQYLGNYNFKSTSDTETILILYKNYGIKCFEWFNGMFSIAIIDSIKNKILLVRDRLGIKPLVYFQNDSEFIFSSEPKTILKLSNKNFKLNSESVDFYFAFRQSAPNKTFFNEINQLEPASILQVDLNLNTYSRQYFWDLKDSIEETVKDTNLNELSNDLFDLLNDCVNKRLLSDVNVGSYLSGGVDSSIISYLMSKKSKEKINTYTIGFNELNEFSYARLLSDRIKSNHYEYTLSNNEYYNSLEKLIEVKDAPLSVPNEIPLYLMSKKLKEHSTVVLSGEGADEIFGGYGRVFSLYRDIKNLNNKVVFDYYSNLLENKEKLNFENIFYHKYRYVPYKIINNLTEFNFNNSLTKDYVTSKLGSVKSKDLRVRTSYFFETFHLRGLLSRLDSSTMAASVEGRVPFVDHRIVESSFKIPFKYKIFEKNINNIRLSHESSEKDDIPKYILKKMFENKIDDSILYRKKVGFPVPLTEWLSGKSLSRIKEVLLDQNSSKYINKNNTEKFLSKREFNYEDSYFIWMMYNLELFVKKYNL